MMSSQENPVPNPVVLRRNTTSMTEEVDFKKGCCGTSTIYDNNDDKVETVLPALSRDAESLPHPQTIDESVFSFGFESSGEKIRKKSEWSPRDNNTSLRQIMQQSPLEYEAVS
jgi:hypothetical protein